MELQEFIKKTLIEVACGVHEARIIAKDLVSIVPDKVDKQSYNHKVDIEFDVALTVSDKKTKDSGLSGQIEPTLKVLGASIGAGLFGGKFNWGSEKKDEQVQRINFRVPVLLNGNHRNDEGAEAETEFVKNAVKRIKDEN